MCFAVQMSQGARIVPALVAVMDNFSEPRVQAHSCAAIVNFSECTDADVLTPFMDRLVGTLVQLVQNGKKIVQVRR